MVRVGGHVKVRIRVRVVVRPNNLLTLTITLNPRNRDMSAMNVLTFPVAMIVAAKYGRLSQQP